MADTKLIYCENGDTLKGCTAAAVAGDSVEEEEVTNSESCDGEKGWLKFRNGKPRAIEEL